MRLPNGYGSISKLSGNRRNKFMVRKTIETELDHENGRVNYKQAIIGYAPTKKEALEMLNDYNQNPYDVSVSKTTFEELYRKVYAFKEPLVSKSSLDAYEYAFNNCRGLHNRKFADLRLQDLQDVIDKSDKNYPTLKKVYVLFRIMYEYAMKYDLVGKDYSEFVDLTAKKAVHEAKDEEDKHLTHDEVKLMWKRKDDRFCQSVLVLMWTGLRISEFLNLKKSDVFLEERYFIIPKGKTVNAKRKVPIAEAIYPFFADWYNNGNSEYLYLNEKHPENPVSYDQYLKTFKQLMNSMGLNYTPHATRHTFTSLLADLDVSSTIRAKLNGQSLGNVTETVYTHLDLSVLLEAVNKLECFIE